MKHEKTMIQKTDEFKKHLLCKSQIFDPRKGVPHEGGHMVNKCSVDQVSGH